MKHLSFFLEAFYSVFNKPLRLSFVKLQSFWRKLLKAFFVHFAPEAGSSKLSSADPFADILFKKRVCLRKGLRSRLAEPNCRAPHASNGHPCPAALEWNRDAAVVFCSRVDVREPHNKWALFRFPVWSFLPLNNYLGRKCGQLGDLGVKVCKCANICLCHPTVAMCMLQSEGGEHNRIFFCVFDVGKSSLFWCVFFSPGNFWIFAEKNFDLKNSSFLAPNFPSTKKFVILFPPCL